MRIIIVGAGITGISAAYYLAKAGHSVHIFEKSLEIGGLAGFFKVNGSYLEKYYHHSFSGHSALFELFKELHIDNQYYSRHTKTGFYFENNIYPFVSARDLISFKPLKMKNRLRLGLTSFIMMGIKNWKKLEKRTAIDWLHQYSGEEACRIIWKPLLKMKFGEDYEQISAAWLWNRVVDRKISGKGKEILGYIDGGYKTLFDTLVAKINGLGGNISTGSRVDRINLDNGKISGVSVNGESINGDIVLSTSSIPSFIRMAPFLPDKYVAELNRIRYQGSICVVLKLKKALSSYYWINVSDPYSPFVGIIEHTNFIDPHKYGNRHLVYLTKYSSSKSDIFLIPDEKIYEEFSSHLKSFFSHFNHKNIVEYWVFRDRFSQPIFIKDYSKIMPDHRTPIENLYLLNTSQIYPESRSINSSIRLAKRFALNLANEERK